ncbi:uncharacterized protein LOC108922798 [Scleropages formosus]|uniref:Uncharacterized LOC108922798 n=1 Tax=Scleropages formosus TaxID=113540 RepID=A0A8C9S4U2_SCLFO|nr:uncharacterized protein LOC108922798 [Scleropages formosus]
MDEEYIKRRFKRNADIYRDALERIVEKYSRVDASGMEVCLRSMTCLSDKGVEPWDKVRDSNLLKDMASCRFPVREEGQEDKRDLQDNLRLSDDASVSMETTMEKSTGTFLWESGVESSHLLSSTMSDSHCGQTGVLSQPEDQDEELEQTLSSQGSTLLDLYPSMVSQVGEACRRQRVVEAGSAILRRYRRRVWFPSSHRSSLNSSLRGQGVCTKSSEMEDRVRRRLAYVMDTRAPEPSVLSFPEDASWTVESISHVSGKPVCSLAAAAHVAMATTPSPPQPVCSAPSLGLWGSRKERWPTPPWKSRVQQWDKVSSPGLKRLSVPGSPPERTQYLHHGSVSSVQYIRDFEDHRSNTYSVSQPGPFHAAGLHLSRRNSFSGFQLSHQATRRQIDLEFQKIYHRYVCEARISLHSHSSALACCSPTCSLRKREALLSSSSSSLAALALSPACTRVRKRQLELSCDLSPLSKRFRGGAPAPMSPRNLVGRSTLERSPGSPTCRSPQNGSISSLRARLSPALGGEGGIVSKVTGDAAEGRLGLTASNWMKEGPSRWYLHYNRKLKF